MFNFKPVLKLYLFLCAFFLSEKPQSTLESPFVKASQAALAVLGGGTFSSCFGVCERFREFSVIHKHWFPTAKPDLNPVSL